MIEMRWFLASLYLTILWLATGWAQDLPAGMSIKVGSDGPADEETRSFSLNHFGINVRNLTASMEFYGKVLGMRHIVTINYTPSFSETLMAFAQGGRNGTGFQTGDELLRNKNNMNGVLKLVYFAKSEVDLVPSTQRTSTLGNTGMVVRDTKVVQDRLEKFGAKVLKPVGDIYIQSDGPVATSMNVGPDSTSNATEIDAVLGGLEAVGVGSVLFAEDPDGNMVSFLPEDLL